MHTIIKALRTSDISKKISEQNLISIEKLTEESNPQTLRLPVHFQLS